VVVVPQDVAADHALAVDLATAAGRLLLEIRRGLDAGADPAQVRDAADRESHRFIAAALAERRPDDAVLSEEAADDRRRLRSQRVWIIDPLDGTREFGEAGRDDWTVHVALCIDGQPLVGAVALPVLGLCLSTAEPPVPSASMAQPPRMVVSRSRPPAWIPDVAADIGAQVISMGSAGAKCMAVACGLAEAYVHGGGQYQWDSAAPVAVALAAGLHASRIDGSALIYNRPEVSVPDLVVCRREFAPTLLASLARRALGITP
jgi:3'(2'), 5'-bisphosphate nucleotidase